MAFIKGQSGNPNGRPKLHTLEEIRAIARKAAPEMVEILIDIARNSQSDKAKTTAASAILDRGYGKPPQTIADEDGNAMSWFDLLSSAQRRLEMIDATPLRLGHDVN